MFIVKVMLFKEAAPFKFYRSCTSTKIHLKRRKLSCFQEAIHYRSSTTENNDNFKAKNTM